VLQGVSAEFISSTEVKIKGKINLSSFYRGRLAEDDNFILSVVTQKHDLTTAHSDKVNVLAGVHSYQLDLSDAGVGDIDIKFIAYPESDFERNPLNYAGHFLEDVMLCRSLIGVDVAENARVQDIRVRIFATNPSFGSFNLETESFSFANSFLVSGVQEIDIESPKGYQLSSDNIFNIVSLKRAPDFDSGTVKKYELLYPFKIRWEKFIALAGVSSQFFSPSEPNNGFNNNWQRYFAASGWSIYFSVQSIIQKDGVNNVFAQQADLLAHNYDDATDWEGEIITETESGTVIPTIILSDQKTKVKAEFTKVFGFEPSIENIEGIIEIEPKDAGGDRVIRSISTIRETESGNPFISITNDGLLKKEKTGGKYIFNAEINNQRLKQVFPNASSFDISARIYELPIPDNGGGGWNHFIATWDTTKLSTGSSDSDQVRLPLVEGGDYEIVVDWGDGTFSAHSNATITFTDGVCDVVHTYAAEGVYTIKVRGIFKGFRFNYTQDRLKILEVIQWGCLRFTNQGGQFYGCENINGSSGLNDLLNLEGITTMGFMFADCKKLEGFNLMEDWDVSGITNMNATFAGCSKFNHPLNWNTSNVTNISQLFKDCVLFNQPLNWDTSKVTNMVSVFFECSVFNQPLEWDTSKVTNASNMFYVASAFNQPLEWDTSSMENISGMFVAANSFNQPLNWDTSKVKNANFMFGFNTVFNQPLNWNLEKAVNLESMFSGATAFSQNLDWTLPLCTNMITLFNLSGITKANYDFFLTAITGWTSGSPTKTLQSNVSLGAQGKNFTNGSDAEDARDYLINTLNWTVTDAGGI
jgi:hypothetical protein